MNDTKYNDWQIMSDNALSLVIGKFVNHHRLKQNRSQEDVAKNAGISRSTLSLLERGETVTVTTLLQVFRVLDLLHIMDQFEIQEEVSPLHLAKLEKKKRKRSRRKANEEEQPSIDW